MDEREAIKFARDVLNRKPDFRGMLARTGCVRVAVPAPPPLTYEAGQLPVDGVAPFVEVTMDDGGKWDFKVFGLNQKE